MLLDVSQVEALLSLQIPMIHMALDMLINICDREPLSLSQPQGLMSSKLEMLYRRHTDFVDLSKGYKLFQWSQAPF